MYICNRLGNEPVGGPTEHASNRQLRTRLTDSRKARPRLIWSGTDFYLRIHLLTPIPFWRSPIPDAIAMEFQTEDW